MSGSVTVQSATLRGSTGGSDPTVVIAALLHEAVENQEVPVAREKKQQLAKVTPSAATDKPEQPQIDLPRALQAALRRVDCSTGAVNGILDAGSQKALTLFNRYAATKFQFGAASVEALEAVKSRSGRVCPLICDKGYKADGNNCVRTSCPRGYRLR